MINILELFGGVGLFLYGMNLMGSSLEKLAGGGLEKILQTLTTSKKKGVGAIKGWTLGLGVTGIIQSSAATTIMLIGFVNAGIMTLAQAIPVVYGANVGSTVTAQILRLGDLGSGNLVLKLLKPSSFAPMLVAVGAFIFLFVKKQKVKDVAGILVGLGTLFYGMTMMEEVFAPLKESEKFQEFFLSFNNPFIGILTGLILTAIIQSSSASVGILQALSATGSVTFGTAVPIIIGQNIGKCMTIMIGSIGANKKAKRVALTYLLFNIIGALVITLIVYAIYYTVGIPMFSDVVNRGDIANIHLMFNLVISMVLLPFSSKMASLTGKILKDTDEVTGDEELRRLDDMLLKTPGIALNQCKELMKEMGEKIQENYKIAFGLFTNFDKTAFTKLTENENFIDKCETALSAYIVKIDRQRLTVDNKSTIFEILNSIGDYERIGDYCMSLAYIAQENYENKVVFSTQGMKELQAVGEATGHIIDMTFDSFNHDKLNEAYRVNPLEKAIRELADVVESHHIDRLQEGDCGVAGGVALYDSMNCFERIAIHCKAVSKHIIKRVMRDNTIDSMHGHLTDKKSEEYIALEKYYYEKYIEPISGKKIEGTAQPVEADKPKEEAKKADKPKEEAKKADKPKEEAKKADKPKEEAKKADKPKEEAKKVDKSKEEAKKTDKSKNDSKKTDKDKNTKTVKTDKKKEEKKKTDKSKK